MPSSLSISSHAVPGGSFLASPATNDSTLLTSFLTERLHARQERTKSNRVVHDKFELEVHFTVPKTHTHTHTQKKKEKKRVKTKTKTKTNKHTNKQKQSITQTNKHTKNHASKHRKKRTQHTAHIKQP